MPKDKTKKSKPNPTAKKPAPERAPARDPRGRKKEKGQISVRIEQSTLDMAKALAHFWNENITDVLELAIREAVLRRVHEARPARLARFLLLHATPDEQRIVTDVLVFLRLPPRVFSEFDELYRAGFLQILEKTRTLPEYEEVLEKYAGQLPPLVAGEDLLPFFESLASLVHQVEELDRLTDRFEALVKRFPVSSLEEEAKAQADGIIKELVQARALRSDLGNAQQMVGETLRAAIDALRGGGAAA
jgi:hypothetical protein